jgi:hypothetical protein
LQLPKENDSCEDNMKVDKNPTGCID